MGGVGECGGGPQGWGWGGGCVVVDHRIGMVVWKFGHRQFWWGSLALLNLVWESGQIKRNGWLQAIMVGESGYIKFGVGV